MGYDHRDRAKKHAPKDGDTLQSIAQQETAAGNPISWQEIARFNWGTDNPDVIDEFLRDELGCYVRGGDKRFVMSADAQARTPLLIPRPFAKDGLATETTHTIKVRKKDKPPKQFESCTRVEGITFEYDSDKIRKSETADVDKAAEVIKANPNAKAMIFGHTDKVGSETYNKGLSERRAKSLFTHLTTKSGIDAGRFMDPKHMGCGEFNPEVETEAANEPNRRVTVFLFNPDRLPNLPCANGDIAPCKKQVAAPLPRNKASFHCSFYDSIAKNCPAESGPPVPPPPPSPCPTKAEFKEHADNIYGYDDHTDANVPWKSVEKDKTDKVEVILTPAGRFAKVKFESSDTGKVTVSPDTAASDKQTITITGVAKGEAEIKATCEGTTIGRMKVKICERKTRTVAYRVVNEKNYTSTDLAKATIEAFLKKVYIQAVFEWKLTKLPAKTVAFDTITTTGTGKTLKRTAGADSKIDVESWTSKEMDKVIAEAKDDSFDNNIFLVDNPSDGSFGFMDFNQRYGFIHADSSSTSEKSFAHELGHGGFGLQHKNDDKDNNMSQGQGLNKVRLRKDQWDKINP